MTPQCHRYTEAVGYHLNYLGAKRGTPTDPSLRDRTGT